MKNAILDTIKVASIYNFKCWGPKATFAAEYMRLWGLNGGIVSPDMLLMLELKWRDRFCNVVPGKNFILNTLFKSSGYTSTWYMGLISATGYTELLEADTAASHAGWVEDTNYSQSNRPTLAFADAANNSITLSSSVSFSANGVSTIKGAFVSSDNTKGGAGGALLSEGLFATGDKPIEDGYILNASYTMNLV